jgi:hypothetical protein
MKCGSPPRKTDRSPLIKIGDFITVLCDHKWRGLWIGGYANSQTVQSLHVLAAKVLDRFGPRL